MSRLSVKTGEETISCFLLDVLEFNKMTGVNISVGYGDSSWNCSGEYIHIHHVIPLKYCGTNDFMNLFPLPASEHTSVVTPWWSRY